MSQERTNPQGWRQTERAIHVCKVCPFKGDHGFYSKNYICKDEFKTECDKEFSNRGLNTLTIPNGIGYTLSGEPINIIYKAKKPPQS